MTKSLTTLIANVQALLLDDGTRFSAATVTAAVRSALKDYNRNAPVYAGTLLDVVSGQREYVLNAADFTNLVQVLSVLKQGTDSHLEYNLPLAYDDYFEDEVPVFRLRLPEASGFLIVRYSLPHTVSGLDSAIESTIPDYYDNVLTDGACFYSCLIRSAGRIETINLNQAVSENLQKTQEYYRQAFVIGLREAASRKAAVSELNTMAWNDQYAERTV